MKIKLFVIGIFLAATMQAQSVKLSEVEWKGVGCYKIEMPMGTVYFEKDNGVSGFKSFIDSEGNDWIASYLPPGPNGDFRGFPNSVGNFGHAGRDSKSTTTIVDGKTEGELVILESSNGTFTFQYYFFADRVAIKVLKSEGDYNFLLECVPGGTADAEDYFVTPDGKKHIPTVAGEFNDFTPEMIYIGDPKSKDILFFAKSPNDDAPNENHRQFRPGNIHNMDLYGFGRTGADQKYQVFGMSGNEHICIIGFTSAKRKHNEITALVEGFLADPFTSGVGMVKLWSTDILNHDAAWYASQEARSIADNVIKYQSYQGGWPKSTDLARAPLTAGDYPADGDGRINSLDNNATTLPMEFLARVAAATDTFDYRASFLRGLDYLFAAQYSNGGWPQFWPLRGDAYYSRITYNDEAMIRVMKLLKGVADGEPHYAFVDDKRREKAKAAVDLGIDCILNTQVIQKGKRTAWCAQHDENTLEPAWARAYEPPSLSGGETVDIIRFLMSIENPSDEIKEAIKGGVSWLRKVAIKGVRLDKVKNPDGRTDRKLVPDKKAPLLWARFYELETNRPLYLDRDSVFRYDFSEIGYERRSGYGYNGYWAADLLDSEYPNWLKSQKKSKKSSTKSSSKESNDKTNVDEDMSANAMVPLIIEAEKGVFTGHIDRHSCWHNIMLSDAPHSTHSGRGIVDTKNEIGSYIEVDYDAKWTGPHRITVRYTHIKKDLRPGALWVNGASVATLAMPQTEALAGWKTDVVLVQLKAGKNVIRLSAINDGGLPNMDYIKVAEVRDVAQGMAANIEVLEAEDGRFTGKEDHHSCWNFIAQIDANHSGFTGEGYVDTKNEKGSYIEVAFDSPKAGPHNLGIRYVHGKKDVRSAQLVVNGVVANSSIDDFVSTKAWTQWTTINMPIELKSGPNTIRLNALGDEGLTNIDHFVITQKE
ncbi:pectate lyase [Aurantibacter crassamenti]|uniref:pectate lyase n=1 Tax=Aurantibacter crassamenti TaxID=1837375 RepID=UPI00193A3F41|nr:pectate lyase [Aurantibacter crassamenti]MBM1104546.1 pectate lyase [Aurantibacter crassamenti]